jgi:hypothetical protein
MRAFNPQHYGDRRDLSYAGSEVDGGNLDDDFDTEDLERSGRHARGYRSSAALVTGRASPFGTDTEAAL